MHNARAHQAVANDVEYRIIAATRSGKIVWSGRGAYESDAAADLERAAAAARRDEGAER